MNFLVQSGDETIILKNLDLAHRTVELEGRLWRFDFLPVRGDSYSLILNGEVFSLQIRGVAEREEVSIGPHLLEALVEDERGALLRKFQRRGQVAAGGATIRAPMPGLIVRLEVEKGQPVERGQSLIVIEAMKMENEIKSPIAGRIAEILVRSQMTVEKDAPLLHLTN